MINSRSPADLTPEMQILVVKFFGACMMAKMKVILTSTYRDFESQDALYAQGRTTPGKIVTNAKGGQSAHNFRVAFDAAPVGPDGKVDWNDTAKFKQMGAIGKSVGLDWSGDWVKFPELAHFQLKGFVIPKEKK